MYRTIQEYAHMRWLFGSDFMGGMIDGKGARCRKDQNQMFTPHCRHLAMLEIIEIED